MGWIWAVLGEKDMNRRDILEVHLMGYGEQLIVEFEDGGKVEKEESRFTLKIYCRLLVFWRLLLSIGSVLCM